MEGVQPRIYFFVNPLGPPTSADYQHCIISFAEGLQDLSICFDSNNNYYNLGDNQSHSHFLFNKKEISTIDDYNKYDILVAGQTARIPKNILTYSKRKYKTILLDWSDGINTYIKDNVAYYDFYFKTSYNKKLFPQANVYPLAFCLTNRIINTVNSIECSDDYEQRHNTILYSHRIQHYIRQIMLRHYQKTPKIVYFFNDGFKEPTANTTEYLHWHQSGRRHNVNFYKTLLDSKICDCTGGYFAKFSSQSSSTYIYQVDSFKLWEAFAAGCVVICIDFDRYGIKLPFQPINGVHYIGITADLGELNRLSCHIENNTIDLESIAKKGKEWALSHYSPKPFAEYIINTYNTHQSPKQYRSPQAVCTMATEGVINDLKIFIYSLRLFEPEIPLYILCDTKTKEIIEKQNNKNNTNIYLYPLLDKYSGKNRTQMEQENIWTEFMLKKCDIIDIVLDKYSDVLFADTDMCFLNSLPPINHTKQYQLGASPHFIKKADTDKYGYYNGGYLWVANKNITTQWKEYTKTARFFEQSAIEDIVKEFNSFEFPIQNNFGWWRLFQCDHPQQRYEKFSNCKTTGDILFDGEPLRSIHTHLTSNTDVNMPMFNNIIKTLLNKGQNQNKNYMRLLIFLRILTQC